jgi:predicted AlkP superfamily pyrophosphatase or phosphodiesterase
MLYYTTLIDHMNHAFGKEHIKTFKTTYAVERTVLDMIQWIDKNPEYALIVTSDHGGQRFDGEDNYCNHGCITNLN